MRTLLTVALLGLLLGACGGGGATFGGASPKVVLSATALGFGTELVGET